MEKIILTGAKDNSLMSQLLGIYGVSPLFFSFSFFPFSPKSNYWCINYICILCYGYICAYRV